MPPPRGWVDDLVSRGKVFQPERLDCVCGTLSFCFHFAGARQPQPVCVSAGGGRHRELQPGGAAGHLQKLSPLCHSWSQTPQAHHVAQVSKTPRRWSTVAGGASETQHLIESFRSLQAAGTMSSSKVDFVLSVIRSAVAGKT